LVTKYTVYRGLNNPADWRTKPSNEWMNRSSLVRIIKLTILGQILYNQPVSRKARVAFPFM
jgi:sucrose-6-phosphate hydrolase SacC (GH32 family)